MATLFGCNISLTVAADFMAFPKDWQEETTDKKQEKKRDRRFVGAMRCDAAGRPQFSLMPMAGSSSA